MTIEKIRRETRPGFDQNGKRVRSRDFETLMKHRRAAHRRAHKYHET